MVNQDQPLRQNPPDESEQSGRLNQLFGFDLRSLALFRIGIALVVLADLIIRAGDLTAHYSDDGILPRSYLIETPVNPWYWSIHLLSGQPFVQGLVFLLAGLIAFALLVGYRTRLATIATWVLVISLHNRHPYVIFAADDVLRALLFWAMFLPWGAVYSVDSALNNSSQPLPKRFASIATFAFMVQQVLIYAGSAAYKAKSEVWHDGSAVYYALSFDQYATPIGQFFLAHLAWLLPPLTIFALWFEFFGPFLIFIPVKITFFRCLAILLFISLHISFGLFFTLELFPYLSIASWLAFIPSPIWDYLGEKMQKNKARQGLVIYYDRDCGFCKKVVHLLRTFLILPGTPLRMAQDYEAIYADMEKYNSWVVVDGQGNHHYKWEAMAYVVSLSPLFFCFAPILRIPPLMSLGNKIYETIASNRRLASKFTAPLQFRSLQLEPSLTLNIVALILFLLTLLWNVTSFVEQTVARRPEFDRKPDFFSFAYKLLNRKTFNQIEPLGKLTRLDQNWTIFAPSPPRDDGWHVIQGNLNNGKTVDLMWHKEQITFAKPTRQERDNTYHNSRWRTFYINLNRSIGGRLYPYYASYLCRQWNKTHSPQQQLTNVTIYYMDERTVPPGETQTVEKKVHYQADCSQKN
jgi:predicted DCC family thiol-disulfide oxidoreductase YuxK